MYLCAFKFILFYKSRKETDLKNKILSTTYTRSTSEELQSLYYFIVSHFCSVFRWATPIMSSCLKLLYLIFFLPSREMRGSSWKTRDWVVYLGTPLHSILTPLHMLTCSLFSIIIDCLCVSTFFPSPCLQWKVYLHARPFSMLKSFPDFVTFPPIIPHMGLFKHQAGKCGDSTVK